MLGLENADRETIAVILNYRVILLSVGQLISVYGREQYHIDVRGIN